MSNKEASKVYEIIVNNVISDVREEFENVGIDEQTLQDLRRVWREKLSEVKTTTLSWDNAPMDNIQQQIQDQAQLAKDGGEITVKSETQGLVLPGLDPSSTTTTNGIQQNTNKSEVPSVVKTEEGHQEIKAEENIEDPNKLEKGQQFELEIETQLNPMSSTTSLDGDLKVSDEKEKAQKTKRSALLDTDEVGSELDDSDDDYLISEGEDEGPDENLLLCLYEKVTRTKARWKCSLKDGIATINRRDYTFQKAHVEAEWV
ncbi:hypothetical protein TPHA_0I01550 [Tetrapisispora phaffii CBS 4417]|uniref:Transcription initiation factor IIA large subunit n=1 Tax=Tetrapisispora phaffii (strain ATCC 24235 / CBS 4417 / NBRC 1672 / NRRL Y-8282 / UCD 70-5) TaxID=1071381 RepID=G8BXN3_TETPH|nr:hypothetical protein TPHA_0I01550 [Tetrapisispora phaffii CBS 4417]CCE64661.1 hypothetical protein TPHA_0I01550 [Tetrapisispora phaffii CBS 4417]